MEIIDAQVHLNMLLPNWKTVEPDTAVGAGVSVMDAVGIDRVLIADLYALRGLFLLFHSRHVHIQDLEHFNIQPGAASGERGEYPICACISPRSPEASG